MRYPIVMRDSLAPRDSNLCRSRIFHDSPGKLPFYRNRIARKFFTPQSITMMSPDEHTKSPKKSEVGKYG